MIIKFLPFVLIILLSSCSKDPISPTGNDEGEGKVSLTFNKNTIPPEIIKIKASLSRKGFNAISDSILIGSDSIITMYFAEIPSGDWNLEVLAYNQRNTIKYKGSREVIIITDYTSEVYLTLEPMVSAGQGYGNIKIYIKWVEDNRTKEWIRYEGNPLTLNSNSEFVFPTILKDDNNYKLYITEVNSNPWGKIVMFTGLDALNWDSTTNIIKPTYPWEQTGNSSPVVVKVNNVYYMYYVGSASRTGAWEIGLATSSDGIIWTKRSEPIMSPGIWDKYIPNSVIYKDGKFHLHLTHFFGHGAYIMEATSNDGVHFMLKGYPTISATLSWEKGLIYHASVVYFQNKYHMVYSNYRSDAFGYATSIDGETWIKEKNPIHTVEKEPVGAREQIAYPKLFVINNELVIYYNTLVAGKFYLNMLLRK